MTLLAFAIVCGCIAYVGGQHVPSAAAAPSPASGPSIYFGVEYPGAPDIAKLQQYESELQHGIPLVLWYQGWEWAGQQTPFPAAQFDAVRAHGSIPVLAWYPMDGTVNTIDQTKFQLAQIINGTWDAYIQQFATQVKAWGHPFFLRFASEMNGNWTSWSEMVNGNHAGEYARAWRHVHDIFTQVGAKNATWTWCPNVENATTTPLEDLYPGSNYVDWACLDGYNFATDLSGAPWRSFSQIFHGTYQHLLALIPPSMPIMIGEMGTVEHGGSKPDWIKDALAVQIPKNYPRIKGVIWFEDTNPGLDLRFDTSPGSLAATRSSLASGAYVDNSYRYLDQTPIPVPGGVSLKPSSPPVFHGVNSPAPGYVQVLDSAQNAPLSSARLIYADGTFSATDAEGLAAIPEGGEHVLLTAIGVNGGTLAVRLLLDLRLGYQIQVDIQSGSVIGIRVHDPPPPPPPPSPKSRVIAALAALKAAPRSWVAMIGLTAPTLFLGTVLLVRMGARALFRRVRVRAT